MWKLTNVYFFLSGLYYYFWAESWATRGNEDKHHTIHPIHGLLVSLGCAQGGRESCHATVLHMVAGRDLIGRKRSKQSIACVPVSSVSHEMAKLPHHRRDSPYSSLMLRNWLSTYEKDINYCPSAPQTPQDISKSLPHPISNKGITESDCEISFPFIHSPSVPCWQHKRRGKWKLSLRETLYRRKAFICLSLIVPWTFLEKMVALCQCICQTLLWHEPHWRSYEHSVLWLPSAWNILNLHSRWRRQGLKNSSSLMNLKNKSTELVCGLAA